MPNQALMQTPLKDRLAAGAGATVIVAGLGYVLLLGLHVDLRAAVEQPLALLNVALPKPPPPKKKPEPIRKPSPAKEAKSPPNLRKKAAPIIAPPPIVLPPPIPTPVPVAPVAGPGNANNAGASNRPGAGYGAGGEGNGRGGGGDGDGGTPPEPIRDRLKFSDLPQDLRHPGFEATVGVRYAVETDGHVSSCRITRSSRYPELDAVTCDQIMRRFRYRPARDDDGRPVRSTIVVDQSWGYDRGEDDSSPR